MSKKKNPNSIYKDITNSKTKLRDGIILLVTILKEIQDDNTKTECKEILKRLVEERRETLNIYRKILNSHKDSSIRLIIAKEFITNYYKNYQSLIQEQIKNENSAIFITLLRDALRYQKTNTSNKFINNIIKKYAEIYQIVSEEAEFFLDLEETQIEGSEAIDFEVGYFKKFLCNNIEKFKSDPYYRYLLKDGHVIALNLSNLELNSIPQSIGNLSELQYLNLANLGLNRLPDPIKNLSKLQFINLSGNCLTYIPNWLEKLAIANNSKYYIKEGVVSSEAFVVSLIEFLTGSRLEQLKNTNKTDKWGVFSYYRLNESGNIVGLYINAENSKIGIFPDKICSLTYLQELDLFNCSIEKIPNCIGDLEFLKYLDLSFNKIKSLPKSISKLKNLEFINLEDNEISEKNLFSFAWYNCGQFSLINREFEKAIKECKETLDIFPKNKTAWLNLGIAFSEIKDFDQAEQALKNYLNIDPLDTFAMCYLSDIYHQKGNYNKAIEILLNSIEIKPKSALLWTSLGFNYKKLGKYDKAIETYLHSLKFNPNNRNVWKDLADIYRAKGEYLKAIEAEENATNLDLLELF